MYDILIKSRKEAIAYSYNKYIDDCIIISINDSDDIAEFDKSNDRIKAVCSVVFHDIKVQTNSGILMSKAHAQKIKEIVDAYKDKVKTIVVHCYAGISRSSAVACAISIYLNGDDMNIWKQGIYYPNEHCYKTMLREFGIAMSYEDICKRYDATEYAFDRIEGSKSIKEMFL